MKNGKLNDEYDAWCVTDSEGNLYYTGARDDVFRLRRDAVEAAQTASIETGERPIVAPCKVVPR